MTLDLTKRNADGTFQAVQTRDGRKARIICVEAKNPAFPIIALITTSSGMEAPEAFTSGGSYCPTTFTFRDLIPIPTRIKRDVWLNVYDHGTCAYEARRDADDAASKDRRACIKAPIDCEEGSGL